MYWHIWHHNWRKITSYWQHFLSDLMENATFELLPKEPQYINFIGFTIEIIDFLCYFNDLTKFWSIWRHNWREMTSFWRHFLSDLMEKAKFECFIAKRTTIYQFYRIYHQIIDFCGQFNALTEFWHIWPHNWRHMTS